MDNDVLAYRVLLEKRKENAPFWEKKVLTVEEAAEYTAITRYFVRQLCKENKIVHIKAGQKYLINYDKFIDYLDKQFSI